MVYDDINANMRYISLEEVDILNRNIVDGLPSERKKRRFPLVKMVQPDKNEAIYPGKRLLERG